MKKDVVTSVFASSYPSISAQFVEAFSRLAGPVVLDELFVCTWEGLPSVEFAFSNLPRQVVDHGVGEQFFLSETTQSDWGEVHGRGVMLFAVGDLHAVLDVECRYAARIYDDAVTMGFSSTNQTRLGKLLQISPLPSSKSTISKPYPKPAGLPEKSTTAATSLQPINAPKAKFPCRYIGPTPKSGAEFNARHRLPAVLRKEPAARAVRPGSLLPMSPLRDHILLPTVRFFALDPKE